MSNLPKSFFNLINTADKPVLVDFYADWCGPCKMVSPVIERIAKEKKGQILTVKINTDAKPQISQHYKIASIPTIMMFKNGEAVMRLQGAMPYESLIAEINKYL